MLFQIRFREMIPNQVEKHWHSQFKELELYIEDDGDRLMVLTEGKT